MRTLDAIRVATLHSLRERRQEMQIATYDARLEAAATRLGFALFRV